MSEPNPTSNDNLLPNLLEQSRVGKLGKPHKQILALLHSREVPLSAKEIWKIINFEREQRGEKPIARNSYRVYLRQLHEKKYVIETTFGRYTVPDKLKEQGTVTKDLNMGISESDGSVVLPHLHNVRLVVRGVKKGWLTCDSWQVRLGEVLVTFVNAGGDVITVTIDCDKGYSMDLHAWKHVEGAILHELRVSDRAQIVLELPSCELNRDYAGFRLDGLQAMTLYAFDGVLERYYNKGKGLRHEVKLNKTISTEQLEVLLHGGVPTYNIAQGVFAQSQRIGELTDAVKGSNRLSAEQQARLANLFEGFFNRLDKMLPLLEQLGSLGEKIDKVSESLDELKDHEDVLSRSVFALGRLVVRRKRSKPKPPKKQSTWQRLRRRLQR